MIILLDEKTADAAAELEVIPITAEVKQNVAMAICRAAKNGNLLFSRVALYVVVQHAHAML